MDNPNAIFRRHTIEVMVGDVGVGAHNPLRLQSMTTTDTRDTAASIDQAERLAAAGCEIVRLTAPSIRDAEALAEIRAGLNARGVRVPLVADIHFTPNAALVAAEHVEKVRINPGNYSDRKKFEVREYSDAEYRRELERMAERFRPLVRRCRELGRAMRIGTNHGSLSDRIMNRFGDTPLGMVESALEFLDVCEDEGYRQVIFSMKSSNPRVAIHAYRLLAQRLHERAPGLPSYPVHLGVTEAGAGDEGRVKSAVGIGALLEEGIGDTIRVSLTEDPLRELPVARALAERYDARFTVGAPGGAGADAAFAAPDAEPHYERRKTRTVGTAKVRQARQGRQEQPGRQAQPKRQEQQGKQGQGDGACSASPDFGGEAPVRVEAWLGPVPEDAEAAAGRCAQSLSRLEEIDCESMLLDVQSPQQAPLAVDFARALSTRGVLIPVALRAPAPQAALAAAEALVEIAAREDAAPAGRLVSTPEFGAAPQGVLLEWELQEEDALPALEAALSRARPHALGLSAPATPRLRARLAKVFKAADCEAMPLVLRHRAAPNHDAQTALLHAAIDIGAPLCDGFGDMVSLGGLGSLEQDVRAAYRVLQAARLRSAWTEFISCPSCGRTLFDLEETTARVQAATGHLPGLKIAVMGCIVNGPGEMADADFGYVGSGVNKVDLYVGKARVLRNVAAEQAPQRLVELIREHGRWREPGPAPQAGA